MKNTNMITLNTVRMGGPFSVTVLNPPEKPINITKKIIGQVFYEVGRIEDMLTDFKNSSLTELNDFAGNGMFKVPRELYELVKYSLDVSLESNGAFDVTYASVGHLWRKAFATGILPEPEEINKALKSVDFKSIKLHPDECAISIGRKGVKIGLGGIGKGYAVDAAALMLKEFGYNNFIINGAGDVRVSSAHDAKRPWRIGIKNPFAHNKNIAGMLEIANGAVATSGDYERGITINGKHYHHVIDARNGKSRDDVKSVTVLAPGALQADVYATTCMALGLNDGFAFLNNHQEVRSIIIAKDGRVLKTGFNMLNKENNYDKLTA